MNTSVEDKIFPIFHCFFSSAAPAPAFLLDFTELVLLFLSRLLLGVVGPFLPTRSLVFGFRVLETVLLFAAFLLGPRRSAADGTELFDTLAAAAFLALGPEATMSGFSASSRSFR